MLDQIRREQRIPRAVTLREFVDEYLGQHEVEPETLDKLRWLLAKAVTEFGDLRLGELRSQEIAAWRMTIPVGHRFEATQALRQVLARAVEWGLMDVNPAKVGVPNPQRRRVEKRPFDSWAELEALTAFLEPRAKAMVVFAAATGLRPGEWIALERRDVDLDERSVHVRRAFRNGRIKYPKTDGSLRTVPLQDVALAALDRGPAYEHTPLLFPSSNGGYFDLHNFRNREWLPAQRAAGIRPIRRVYDLRHTFATFALRAGISTHALSCYMGASLTMIDRHYGHLTSDAAEHARELLDGYSALKGRPWTPVDARWTSQEPAVVTIGNEKPA
jgi:integrase